VIGRALQDARRSKANGGNDLCAYQMVILLGSVAQRINALSNCVNWGVQAVCGR